MGSESSDAVPDTEVKRKEWEVERIDSCTDLASVCEIVKVESLGISPNSGLHDGGWRPSGNICHSARCRKGKLVADTIFSPTN